MNPVLNSRVLKAIARASADGRSDDIATLLDMLVEMDKQDSEPPYAKLLGHCAEFRVKRDASGTPKQINAVFKTSTRSNTGMASGLKTLINDFSASAAVVWGGEKKNG